MQTLYIVNGCYYNAKPVATSTEKFRKKGTMVNYFSQYGQDYVGFGALGEALVRLDSPSHRRVFVVASRNSWHRLNPRGERDFFARREVEIYPGFSNNPDFSEILRGCERYRAFKPDIVFAVGGGSPIDVAKMIKAVVHTREAYDEQEPQSVKPSGDGPPLVAVATTAGSGSEATRFAVFYVGERKQSVSHRSLRPEIAVADPELTYGMPPRLTAETGFDALSQAVESYWAPSASEESRADAAAAIRHILPHLYNAVHEPGPAARGHMSYAAYLAGRAINHTRTTIPHALAYHLTKRHGLAHGHAVALTLPFFLAINGDPGANVTAPAGAEAHFRAMRELFLMLGQEGAGDAVRFWRNLVSACGLAPTLREAGLTTDRQLRDVIASADPARFASNPVAVDPELLFAYFRNEPTFPGADG